jgi:four helix bundle protein
MSSYEDLDAFKACHQLTLATWKVAEKIAEQDGELGAQLFGAALVASSRIARGSGTRNRKMFWACVDRSLCALSEIEYHLTMADTMGLISQEDRQVLESLRGRAVFYSTKLVLDLAAGGPEEKGT